MRILSYGPPGRERTGILCGGQIVDIGALRPDWPAGWRRILEAGLWGEVRRLGAEVEAGRLATEGRIPVDAVRLGPPVPDPSKVIALGLNFRDHAKEQKREPPERPLLFAKAPSCLAGARDPIRLPEPDVESQVDAEAELCVVLGSRATRVPRDHALNHVLGWTVFDDVSGRGAQFSDRQWFRGKSFDTFGPCGPWIVTRDELPDPGELALEADWGDRSMQRGNTRDLIFGVAEVIEYASRTMTLLPGDLICMGTPAGVGVFRDPPVFLKPGDLVRVRLEQVGELANPVVAGDS